MTAEISADIVQALDEVLLAADATQEFKSRFRQLILNAVTDNYADSDVLNVVELAPSDVPEGQ